MATMTEKNLTGARGEAIFFAKMTSYCGREIPYFYPQFLGDKHPTVDHIVSVLDRGNIEACFFAQIKTTRIGRILRNNGKSYLSLTVKKEDLDALAAFPDPTYLFGVDEQTEQIYVMAITGRHTRGFSAMPTDHELTCSSLRSLWDEVRQYWAAIPESFTSRFEL